MSPASLVASLDVDVHLVLCDFGRSGLAYVVTRSRTHKFSSISVAHWMSASLRKRPNCCVAAKCREGPNAPLCSARKTATFVGVRPSQTRRPTQNRRKVETVTSGILREMTLRSA